MNETLPQGWIETTFDAVCYVNGGFAFKSKEYTDSGLPLIRISNIVDEKIALDKKPIFIDKKRLEEFSTFIVEKNDILIALSGATTGKFGKYDLSDIALLNQRVGQFKFINKATEHRDFYFYYLRLIKDKILEESYGNAQPNISPKQLGLFPILLPPLAEQKRIVAKLEALLTRSTNARNELAAIPKLIERYKQAVLAAAFRGDLTADWREENPESTDVENLKKEIEKHIKGLKRRSKIPSKHLLSSGIYPHEWLSYRLEEVCLKIVDGTHHTPEYRDSGVPFISVKDIRDGKIFFNDCKFVSKETHDELSKRCKPEFGDLLITKSGTIGRCAVIETNDEFSLFVSVALLKPFSNRINTNYLKHLMHYWIGTIDVSSEIIGSTIKNLHLQDMQALQVPVPSTEEQEEIVERVQTAFNAIDTIQAELTQAEALRKRLEQATLAKAFRGELVPQDPNDEPASVLLERIRAEREAQKRKKR